VKAADALLTRSLAHPEIATSGETTLPKLTIDRNWFYNALPGKFGKKATAKQKGGFDAIFDTWDTVPYYDQLAWLAYILATAWHETGTRMQPVRESFAETDAQAYQRVTDYCLKRKKENYARRHPNGKSYYGRGYVQLTHAVNYQRAGKELGIGSQLYDDPDKVLDAAIGAKIIVEGTVEGWFTPYSLGDFFTKSRSEWREARRIINRLDKADSIAEHGKKFLPCLRYENEASR
jgi:hypothetical protein